MSSSLRFCANLNFMFIECGDLLGRYALAKAAGFTGVEGPFPPDQVSVEQLVKVRRETGLEQVLMNIALGEAPEGQFGCAAIPGQEANFRANLERTVEYAKAVDCKKTVRGELYAQTTNQYPYNVFHNL